LALIAAIGQLIPYLGAWVTWITFGLVALFQSTTPFGLPPGIYMIIVLAVSMLINNIIDNVLRTSIMAENLKVHPALVLLGALVGVQLFGFIGIVIAAPVMASLQLLLNYVIKKLNDQNPWKDFELSKEKEKAKWLSYLEEKWSKFKQWFRARWQKFKHDVFRKRTKEPEDVQPQSNPDE
jgi:predicted PurR-regulated permease PerM